MIESSRPSLNDHRWGVILAGGDGVRLRPLTRLACGDNRPKQFCPLLGGRTLLAQTQSRISKTVAPDRILFALTKKHEPFYSRALDEVPPVRKVVQPCNRGTLPAILWALLRVLRLDRQALVAFLPSDHHFSNESKFTSALDSAFDQTKANREFIILLGAAANRPETEYGWIEPHYAEANGYGDSLARVKRFWEKPSKDVAQQLFAQGCLWNTFVMVGAADAFLTMVRRASPAICRAFEEELFSADAGEEERLGQVYADLCPSDFSKEVLSVSSDALAVASCGEIGWSDLGDPQRFIAALHEEGVEIPCSLSALCKKCSPRVESMITPSSVDTAQLLGDAVTLSNPQIQEQFQ